MLSRIQSLGSCLIVLTLLLFAGSAGAQEVSSRCEAAMDRAAGHYGKCLLSADASNARHKNPTKLANRQTRCETRFDRRTSRAIRHYGADECPSSDLVAAMEDRTVTYAEGVATEASGTPAPSYLFVQNGTGGTISNTTLTLTGVNSETGYFTDRPYRLAGQVLTEEFLSQWDEGGTFADDPPNADFTCTVDSAVVNFVVELTAPSMAGADLSYAATHVGYPFVRNGTITCEADSHLFIDDASQTVADFKAGCFSATEPEGVCFIVLLGDSSEAHIGAGFGVDSALIGGACLPAEHQDTERFSYMHTASPLSVSKINELCSETYSWGASKYCRHGGPDGLGFANYCPK